ncbi:MAG: 16S rRNA (cytidine(1402)-2'-O)-methyltransferase [Planctomycetes bacterium]|nr:16S rRNA (cytidine(1402)-2'-O)-methyltransferase [Planctomycetota bacterium]
MACGTLYVVATPIGNLEDLTPRARRILGEVACIAAEDTRTTRGLLTHLGLRTPCVSYFEHNRRSREEELLDRLRRGESVAIVSEAGTPGLSDPGAELVAAAAAERIPVVPIPGPNAAATALSISGWNADAFAVEGFLPRKGRDRTARLARLAAEARVTVLYESPHRLTATLRDLADACGADRAACVCRELTKLHEECWRGTLGAAAEEFVGDRCRGEIVVLIAGWHGPVSPLHAAPGPASAPPTDEAIRDGLDSVLRSGAASFAAAVKEVARRLGVPRDRVYRLGRGGRQE